MIYDNFDIYYNSGLTQRKVIMLLRNYVIKKLLLTTVTIAGSLAIIFCGVGLSEVMHTVIGGAFGAGVIFKSLFLQLPMLLSLLLPLSIFIAGILVINDFIASSELVVMQSAGISLYNLNSWILTIAATVALVVGFSSLYLEAKADKIKNEIFHTVNFSDVISGLKPGSFYPLLRTGGIIHVSDDNQSLFVVLSDKSFNKVVTAKKIPSSTSSSSWSLRDIKYYEASLQNDSGLMLQAKDGFVTLNEPKHSEVSKNVKYMSLTKLAKNAASPAVAAVLYWKLALPLSAVILALFIIPVTTNSFIRQKHMKIIVGIMIYGLYLATNLVVRRYVGLGMISYTSALLASASAWAGVLFVYYKWPKKCS